MRINGLDKDAIAVIALVAQCIRQDYIRDAKKITKHTREIIDRTRKDAFDLLNELGKAYRMQRSKSEWKKHPSPEGAGTTFNHREEHKRLNDALDKLVADFIVNTKRLPSSTSIADLMSWSAVQAQDE